MKRCPKCDTVYVSSHTCRPMWECRKSADSDNDWCDVRGADPEEAAEKFLEFLEDCDTSPGCTDVLVRDPRDGSVEEFSVESEAVWRHTARKK